MTRLEDDLRATMRCHAGDVRSAGQLPNGLRRRSHLRRAGTAGLAAVLVVSLAAFGVGVVRAVLSPTRPEPAPAPSLPLVERVAVTPRSNGDIAYPVDGRIVRRAPDGTTTTWVTRDALARACGARDCAVMQLEWSPDGSQLALVQGVVRRTSPSRLSVYVVADDATVPRAVFDCPGSLCGAVEPPSLSWSPDGGSLAVGASVGGGTGVAVVPVDDPAGEPRVVCASCAGHAAAWSPDGRWLAYSGPDGVFRISTRGGRSEPVSPAAAYSLAWSPEGTRLLADSGDAVRVVDLSQRPYSQAIVTELQPPEGPSVPAWAPDGTRVSWFATPGVNREHHAEVWTADPDGSRPQELRQDPCCVDWWSAPIWSPDGRFIVLGLGSDPTRPPDLLILDAADGTEVARANGVGWGPMAWQGMP